MYSNSNGTLASRSGVALVQHHPVSADMAISNFHIQYDRGIAQYRPGEELRGKVVMDVWTPVHILKVEFKIQGFCTVRHFKDSGFSVKPFQEYYISKRITLLAPQAGSSTLYLKRGKYMSDFSYTLPDDIPPTVRQFDLGHGYVFDISYVARAQVCDILHTDNVNVPQVARVVKSTKATFAVSPTTSERNDEPITHAEQIQLFCSPFNTHPTSVLVQLNRGAYTVGEYIKVHIELLTPVKKRVRQLVAELEQSVRLQLGKKSVNFRQTLIKAVDNGRGRKLVPKSQEMPYGGASDLDMIKTGFRLPIPPNFVPSHLPSCQILDTTYCIKVTVKFGRFGGSLIERIPITVHPVTDHEDTTTTTNRIPLFNKPIMQFPYFAKNPARDSMRSTDSRAAPSLSTDFGGSQQRGHSTKYDRVTTKYKTCLTCCGCCLLCLGYGIYD